MTKPILIRVIGMCIGIQAATVEATAVVSLTADVSTVAAGGSITFTVTVTPNDQVSLVTLVYQGETGQDQRTTAPWVFVHQFNTPADNLGVSATVGYRNDDPEGQAMLNVNVVGLKITGSATPQRGTTTGYLAESDPTGKPIDRFDWTFEWSGGPEWSPGSNTYQDDDLDADDKSNWSGKMVVPGTLTCSATIAGVSVQKSISVSPRARTWSTPVTCIQDNEADWGNQPQAAALLGANRDRDSDVVSTIFVPQSSEDDFSGARMLTEVTSGPCSGWWYVLSCTLKCQRETVINKYIKSNGPLPAGASINFYDFNESGCLSSFTSANFVQAVFHHEYRGTPETYKSPDGHQGRIEQSVFDMNHDAKALIEPMASRSSGELAADVNDLIIGLEAQICSYGSDEYEIYNAAPNWGSGPNSLGTGPHSRWNSTAQSWTDCVYGPTAF